MGRGNNSNQPLAAVSRMGLAVEPLANGAPVESIKRELDNVVLYVHPQTGLPHNEHGPAMVVRYNNGNTHSIIYKLNNVETRIGGPAIEMFDEDGNIQERRYLVNGLLDRDDDGPTQITYWSNGRPHKVFWHRKGILHKNTGPAFIEYTEKGQVLASTHARNGEPVLDMTYDENEAVASTKWFEHLSLA